MSYLFRGDGSVEPGGGRPCGDSCETGFTITGRGRYGSADYWTQRPRVRRLPSGNVGRFRSPVDDANRAVRSRTYRRVSDSTRVTGANSEADDSKQEWGDRGGGRSPPCQRHRWIGQRAIHQRRSRRDAGAEASAGGDLTGRRGAVDPPNCARLLVARTGM